MENYEFLSDTFQRKKALKALEKAKELESLKKACGFKWVKKEMFNTKILTR